VSKAVPADVDAVPGPHTDLGEGPFYDPVTDQVSWVDLYQRRVHTTDLTSGATVTVTASERVAFVFPTGTPGEFVAGAQHGVARLGTRLEEPWIPIDSLDPDTALNDGKADARGRLWVGTLSLSRSPWKCAFYRVNLDGSLSTIFTGVGLSNGLGWSPDGSTFYYVDSHRQDLRAFDFDVDRGELSNGRTIAAIPAEDGMPDGLAVDAEGGIWIALYGGAVVRRVTADGRHDRDVRLPVTFPTSVAFGGASNDLLFVTTARSLLDERGRAAEPLAGRLLALRVGVGGAPVYLPRV
jgi:sugar lactone lactonase YvrE